MVGRVEKGNRLLVSKRSSLVESFNIFDLID